jgi:hypothetical protein
MKRSQAFPSNYLGKDDVQAPRVCVIDHVSMVTLKSEHGEEEKPALFFRGDVKPMVLNNTNWITIEAAYGDESDNWRGKAVEVYFDPSVMFGSKRIGGVRLRIPTQRTASNGQHWTLAQAIAACEAGGVSKQELVAAIRAKGHANWLPERDMPLAQQLIADKQVAEPLGEEPLGGGSDSGQIETGTEDIPFSFLPFLLAIATTVMGSFIA